MADKQKQEKVGGMKRNEGEEEKEAEIYKLTASKLEGALVKLQKISEDVKAKLEKSKDLLIFQSTTDPYSTYLSLLGLAGFDLDDVIMLIAYSMVYGRSLKMMNKDQNKDTPAVKDFMRICKALRVKHTYQKGGLHKDYKKFTIKVEHVLAAFPLIAKEVQLQLVSMDLINLKTPFTMMGVDFQSSVSLTVFKNPTNLAAAVMFHEAKNAAYISKRVGGVVVDENKIVTVDGVQMTKSDERKINTVKGRNFLVLGITATDVLAKMLWRAGYNCPPFRATPSVSYSNEVLGILKSTFSRSTFSMLETEDMTAADARFEKEAKSCGIERQIKFDENVTAGCGIPVAAARAKAQIFADFCFTNQVPAGVAKEVNESVGFDTFGIIGKEDKNLSKTILAHFGYIE